MEAAVGQRVRAREERARKGERMGQAVDSRKVCTVVCSDETFAAHANAVAARLGIAVSKRAPSEDDLVLDVGARGISLAAGGLETRCDLVAEAHRVRPDRLSRELVVRAARTKSTVSAERPFAVDATAGFGVDALLLAAAGFDVVLFERDEVMVELLADALDRAAGDERVADAVARMDLRRGDSIEELPALARRPDVVLLDPMFPARSKSAQVKKKFQLIHRLEGPSCDEAALLDAARCARPRKTVIKRTAKGPYLAGVKPTYSLSGKAVRYDVIVDAGATSGGRAR